jgi:hypothetical protein
MREEFVLQICERFVLTLIHLLTCQPVAVQTLLAQIPNQSSQHLCGDCGSVLGASQNAT